MLSASFEWPITGDDNNNCTVTVEYRRAGTVEWRPAQPLLRVEHGLWTHGEDPGNLLAGSLFFLQPGTSYEARLTLSDPDGGYDQQVVAFQTRQEPRAAALRTRYVIPGAGGGLGTAGAPFRGLAAADSAAAPGDLFLLAPGTYAGPFIATHDGQESLPIVYRGAGAAITVINGGGDSTSLGGCVRFTGRRHVFLENVGLVNAFNPLVADSSTGGVVRGCTITPNAPPIPLPSPLVFSGMRFAMSSGAFIADNTLNMPGAWATVGRTGAYGYGGYGILLEGPDHVVCHNAIREAWDAISIPVTGTAVPAIVTRNVDIYENDIDRASDDGIQADATHHNIRIFHNRLLNTGSAVSFQPIFGGPGYVLFNEAYNNRIEPWKFHQETFYGGTQETSGMFVAHNTSVDSRNAWYESGIWRHGTLRANLLLGARTGTYSFYAGYTYAGASFDYDGWNRVGGYSTLVRYSGSNYADLPAFFAGRGHEQHGIEVGPAIFENGPLPHDPQWNPADGYGWAYRPQDVDLRLRSGANAVDAGLLLPNLNDGYRGAAPDLGCYERGAPARRYGPRTDISSPWASVHADTVLGLVARQVRFVGEANDSSRLIVGWHWDFGDGMTSDDNPRPLHAYAVPGTYPVSLTVTNEDLVTATASTTVTVYSLADAPAPPSSGLELERPTPNPGRGTMRFGFSLPSAGRFELAVYDLAGARVKTIAAAVAPAGRASGEWDGTGDDGRNVGPGVYFIRLSTELGARAHKVLRLR
ncbi:MAG: PKD domain-containing protein [Candidatus Eisenbacteria bacterium]